MLNSSTNKNLDKETIERFFNLILTLNAEEPDKIEEFRQLVKSNPQLISTPNYLGILPIFCAILSKNNLALKNIIDIFPDTINQKNNSNIQPIFYSILSENIDALETIISSHNETLKQTETSRRVPIFYAIDRGNIKALEKIIFLDHETLKQTDRNGKTPIFYAIDKEKTDALLKIISSNQDTLNHPNKEGKTAIFYAILNNKLKALDTIIDYDPNILNKRNNNGDSPIFFAIIEENLNALKLILDKYPLAINQITSSGKTPLEKSLEKYFESINEKQPQEEIDKLRSIVNLIYKKLLGVENDPTEEELRLILDIKNKSKHLNLGYTNNNCGLIRGEVAIIYREKLQNLQSSNSPNQFVELGLEFIDSIDKIDNPIKVENEKLYIFNAQLDGHCAYFFFHVNEENKLTDISYCDGNRISTENSLPQDPQYLKGGVRKFNIETPIDFNQEFVNEFLKENSSNINIRVFYNKLRDQGLKLPSSSNSELPKFLTESVFLIPTKAQSRGNCSYKAFKISLRYIFQLQNPESELSRQFDMVERKLEIETQSSDLQDATLIFKEFKGDLTIQSIEDLIKIREDLKQDSTNQGSTNISDEAKNFIIKKINETLEKVQEKSLKKIQANEGDEKQLAIHQRICDLTKPSSKISASSTSITNSAGATLS